MDEAMLPSPAQAVLRWARETPQRVALEEKGGQLTYLQLAVQVVQVEVLLRRAGLKRGQIVVFSTLSRPLSLVLVLAAEVIGAIHATLLESDLHDGHQVVSHANMLCLEGVDGPFTRRQRLFRLTLPMLAEASVMPVTQAMLDRLGAASPPATPVRIATTSGTTGAPKCMLNTRAHLQTILRSDLEAFPPLAGPFIHLSLYGLSQRGSYARVTAALVHGHTVRLVHEMAELPQMTALERGYTQLLVREAETLTRFCAERGRFLNLYYATAFGGAMTPALHAAMSATLSHQIFNSYSSNETGVMAVVPLDGPAQVLPSVSVEIVDEAGQPLPHGTPGRIRARTGTTVSGYLWNAAESARHFQRGWFLTSDMGVMPAPGQLSVLGRMDDMLNIGGVKLAPYPLEQKLKALPGVAEAVLLARQDAMGVGQLHVVVESREPGAEAQLRQAVSALVEVEISPFTLHFVAELPRTATGKLRRAEALAGLNLP